MSGATATLVGVVLCGGSSSRMGTDKALIGPPGEPLAIRVADAIAGTGVDEVVLVGGDGDRLAGLGRRWIPDHAPGAGPLGGLATATGRFPATPLLVCACDLPRLTAAALVPLIDVLHDPNALHDTDALHDPDGRVDVAVFDVDGSPQWSAVALSARAAGHARAEFDRGERALRHALGAPTLQVRHLRCDLPEAIRDADRPEDLPSADRCHTVEVPPDRGRLQ